MSRSRVFASTVPALVLVPALLTAQHPSQFTARDKTEIFIQHVVKFLELDPAEYRSMVLQYEIGAALAEVEEIDAALLGGDFIESALVELYPEYAEAKRLLDEEKPDEARAALEKLADSPDPYIASHAELLRAELAREQGSPERVVAICEGLLEEHRARLVRDYRACELIAEAFREQEKPLFELAQLFLLLIDYPELPSEVEKRAKARLAKLDQKIGRPLHTVAGWMNSVEKALAEEQTGDPTQEQENEIVVALDKLIELQEAKERQTCKNCGSGSCNGACKSGQPKGSRSSKPARVSALPPPGEGEKHLRGVSHADAGSIWGQLRMREASRALQSFRGELPARYEKLLQQYYKDLSRDAE